MCYLFSQILGSENCIVLFHKHQGDDAEEFEMETEEEGMFKLEKEDLVLVFQTEQQRRLLLERGSNLLCIDTTHNTCNYDFLLYSIVVRDGFRKGYCVAHMITNRPQSYGIMKLFYKKLRGGLGDQADKLNPRFLMSDDESYFVTAFKEVFPKSNPQWLICLWHVKQAWKRNLNRIPDGQEQVKGGRICCT